MPIKATKVSVTEAVAKVTLRSAQVKNLEHESDSEHKNALKAGKKFTVLPNGVLNLDVTGKADEDEEHGHPGNRISVTTAQQRSAGKRAKSTDKAHSEDGDNKLQSPTWTSVQLTYTLTCMDSHGKIR